MGTGNPPLREEWVFDKRLDDAAKAAGFASYADFLNSPGWKQLRRKALERDGWRCTECRGKTRLQVHHRRYAKTLGDEPLEWLQTLCEACHLKTHDKPAKPRPPQRVNEKKRRKRAEKKARKRAKRHQQRAFQRRRRRKSLEPALTPAERRRVAAARVLEEQAAEAGDGRSA